MSGFGEQDKTMLRRLRARGWQPTCIYDIGASNGGWTRSVHSVFSDPVFHLFEPLADRIADYAQGLEQLASNPGVNAVIHPVAVDIAPGTVSLGVSDDPSESSLLVETASEYFPNSVEVPSVSLDRYRLERLLPCPDLIKIDVQGAELRILRGAQELLVHTQVLLLETWLTRGYGPRTPVLFEIAQWLRHRGFAVIDFGDEHRDANDRLLAKDVLFARTSAGL